MQCRLYCLSSQALVHSGAKLRKHPQNSPSMRFSTLTCKHFVTEKLLVRKHDITTTEIAKPVAMRVLKPSLVCYSFTSGRAQTSHKTDCKVSWPKPTCQRQPGVSVQWQTQPLCLQPASQAALRPAWTSASAVSWLLTDLLAAVIFALHQTQSHLDNVAAPNIVCIQASWHCRLL